MAMVVSARQAGDTLVCDLYIRVSACVMIELTTWCLAETKVWPTIVVLLPPKLREGYPAEKQGGAFGFQEQEYG